MRRLIRLRRPRLRDLRAFAIVGGGIAAVMVTALGVVLARDPLPANAAPDAGADLARLPLVEVKTPGAPTTDALVVYYSGDNGWQDGDKDFTRGLADAGLPVVAVDSLHYFVRERSPEGAAQDLTAIIDRYAQQWRAQRIVLVGYSFGADALPLIARRLPMRLRTRIAEIALIAPQGEGELALRPYALFDLSGPGARPIAGELRAMGGVRATCIYGSEDWLAVCPHLSASLARPVRTPGGHIFIGQRMTVARIIVEAAGVAPQSGANQPSP